MTAPRRLSFSMRLALAAAACAVSLVVASACQDDPTLVLCRNIPDGGCPIQDNACSDPTCSAIYACDHVSGAWSLDHTCPPHPDADAGDAGAPVEASVKDVDIDVPGASGGPGCGDLQPPDCPLALAVDCPNGCCGCGDLFVCQGGGWNAWGTCADGGAIIQR